IAAALVLRGVAKGGKFAANAGEAKEVKAVGKWLDGLIKAAESGGKAAESGGGDKIGNVADARGGGANC
ncbi:variable large family protein, partial [Borreliella garinii]